MTRPMIKQRPGRPHTSLWILRLVHKSKIAAAAILILTTLAGVASACNIPVFRYALERWKSDAYELIIFHDANFAPSKSAAIKALRASSERQGNITLSMGNVDSLTPAQAAVWKRIRREDLSVSAATSEPHAVLKTQLRQKPIIVWHGALADVRESGILDSPARKKMTSRLLAGDSVVCLLLKSKDEKANRTVRATLDETLAKLQTKVRIPEGVGLPGSELFSEVPLLVQFRTIEVEHGSQEEQFLVGLFSQLQPEAFERGEPLVIPVFGRGRALEVIPGSDLSSTTIEELTLFLSGPCSCQVKDQNPGFDLLFSVDWDRELFGEDSPRPNVRSVSDPRSSPRLLAIPPGREPNN
jgi:hypothetical protein